MIDLYAMTSPNVFKISIMLEEIGLPYRIHHVNLVDGDQYRAGFLTRSPNNKVPYIVDDDGPGGAPVTIFESAAILIYLAEKTGQLLAKDPLKRLVQLQWLMVQTSTVGPMFGQLVHFSHYAATGNDYAKARYTTEMRRIFGVLDRRLTEAEYLGGPDYSIVDVATLPWLRTALTMFPAFKGRSEKEAFADYPGVGRWFALVSAREGVKRGIARLQAEAGPHDATAFGGASPEAIDRFVGRGKYSRS